MFSFRALVSIIFFSSVSVVLLKLVFRNNNVVLRMDIRFLLACMLLILFRMFVPIESPIINNIPIYKFYPDVYVFLRDVTIVNLFGLQISTLELIKLIWIIGAIIALAILAKSYMGLKWSVNRCPQLEDERICRIASKVNEEYGKKFSFKLVREEAASIPFVCGIIKPVIVMPELEFSDKEVYFILKHEMLHYYRGDTLIKVLCEILKAIYWWNPFMYMLSDLVSNMQEINVDFKIVEGLPDLYQLEYSQCLVRVAKTQKHKRAENRWRVSFKKESPSSTHKRISLMMENMEMNGKKTAASILLSAVILGLVVLCPYVVAFEPYSIPEELIDMSVGGREGGIWGVDNKDGTYDLYIDGQYYKTVPKSEMFDGNIKVYDSLEDIE